jgi:hypothetical protein
MKTTSKIPLDPPFAKGEYKTILFRVHFLHALGAGFGAFAGRQFDPLEIGIFSLFGGGIVFAAQFHDDCVHP